MVRRVESLGMLMRMGQGRLARMAVCPGLQRRLLLQLQWRVHRASGSSRTWMDKGPWQQQQAVGSTS